MTRVVELVDNRIMGRGYHVRTVTTHKLVAVARFRVWVAKRVEPQRRYAVITKDDRLYE